MKRLLISVLLAWAVAPVASLAQYNAAVLEINSKDGVYAVGDSIKVWVNVMPWCCDVQEFIVQEDMLRDIRKEALRLTAGRHLVYANVCDKPVNYVFSFGEPGAGRDYKKVSLVGAIVAPETMIPGYTAPKDLKKFWTKQIKRMRELSLECKLTPVPQNQVKNPDILCFDMEITMHEGAPVRGYIAYPKNADPKSLPIVIFAHGAGVKGGWAQSTVKNVVANATRGKGSIALDINAHGMLNGQPQSYYDELEDKDIEKIKKLQFKVKIQNNKYEDIAKPKIKISL